MTDLVTRLPNRLLPDPARVVARLFVPGHEHEGHGESRATGVIGRTLGLCTADVTSAVTRVRERFGDRHRDLDGILRRHYAAVAHRVPDEESLTDDQRALVGAVFTAEASLAGAALFNPSVVAHPDQSGIAAGWLRLLMTVRAVGEGHVSCVEFRTGLLGPQRELVIDPEGPWAETGTVTAGRMSREVFEAHLVDAGADDESTRFLLGELPTTVGPDELWPALEHLARQRVTRQGARHTDRLARSVLDGSYEVTFSPDSTLPGRVLWPHTSAERNGIEDVRMVRFTDDTGEVSYRGTCTAYDGVRIAPQLIETTDFLSFRMSRLAGPAAKDKGMALFPRLVGGRHVALTRTDRESTCLAWSEDGVRWGDPQTVHVPTGRWELVQTGNCGSPVETDAGWLVVTHGVGPLREYSLGALLLDLDDPTRVVGSLDEPLLTAEGDERHGYVPNVVYTCGALRHGDDLLLPYGSSDAEVRFSVVDLPALLDRLLSTTRSNSSA